MQDNLECLIRGGGPGTAMDRRCNGRLARVSSMSVHAVDIAGLYVSEQGRLRRLVRRLVGSKATADDLVQQAFVKLMASADCGNLDNCPAYLTCTVRNLALNHVRDVKRRNEVELPQTDLDAVVDTNPSPETPCLMVYY